VFDPASDSPKPLSTNHVRNRMADPVPQEKTGRNRITIMMVNKRIKSQFFNQDGSYKINNQPNHKSIPKIHLPAMDHLFLRLVHEF
jgi:hypothetical protein